jgi:osmotically inducible lipoprotein OsmB
MNWQCRPDFLIFSRAGTPLNHFPSNNNFNNVKEVQMSSIHKVTAASLGLCLVIGVSACGDMSPRGRDTAIGAGVGAVGGAILTNGSGLGTVGGAAVGGVVGNQMGK